MTYSSSPQIPLPLRLRDDASFANFVVGENPALLSALQDLACGKTAQSMLLWGNPGCGRSHLLQAVCAQAEQSGRSACYVPLSEASRLNPDVLDELAEYHVLALDDVDSVLQQAGWAEALFACYHRMIDRGAFWLLATRQPPAQLACVLPDLRSRLQALLIHHVRDLTDVDKMHVLQQRAKARGLLFAEDVALFLLNRYPRDMQSLMKALERLDQASLVNQRRLTIPFVKQILEV